MNLSKVTTEALQAELERRGFQRTGPKRTCECGECAKCRHRAKVARYMAKRRAAAAGSNQ